MSAGPLSTSRYLTRTVPTRFRLQPTFPLDENRLRLKKLKLVFSSPITGLAYLGALIVGGLFKFEGTGLGGLLAAASGGLFAYWRTKNEQLESKAIAELIQESNLAQDNELLRITDVLRREGHHPYANSLGRFVLLKQRIETRLHADGQFSRKEKEIEVLVDSICAGVCDELTELVALDRQLAGVLTSGDQAELESLTKRQQECHNRVLHAYATMSQTANQINDLLRPSAQPETKRNEESRILDRLIDELREENEIAGRVHERMRDEGLTP